MTYFLKHAYDLHIHCGPDIIPRSVTALEMAERAVKRGMKGFAIKSHYAPTCLQAATVRACYPGCNAVGTITLNASVGGLNPLAVETAARMGAKIVWCPTFDSASQQDYYLKHLPQYIDMQKKMLDAGRNVPSYCLIDESGELCCEMQEVLDVVQSHDLVLATGHITHKETFALARVASKRGFRKLLITHADWEFTHYTVEEQQELVKLGAWIEHSYTSPEEGCVAWEKVAGEIRTIGAQRCIITTDLGKANGKYPDDGLWDYAQRLLEMGFTAGEISAMICQNPGFLVE